MSIPCFRLGSAIPPARVFQKAINNVFGGYSHVLCYLDDLMIFSKSEADHKIHPAEMLALLREHGI